MKAWKATGAVILIFLTGVITGALGVHATRDRPRDAAPAPWPSLVDAKIGPLDAMQKELQLTPEQARRVAAILEQGRTRTRRVLDRCQPELRQQIRKVREAISAELSPEQNARFEVFLRQPRGHGRHHPERSPGKPPSP